MPRSFGKTRPRIGALFLVGGVALVTFAGAACGQILGLDDIDYDVPDGGGKATTPGDATTQADAPSGTTDGSLVGDAPYPSDDAAAPDALITVAHSPGSAGAVQGLAIDDTRNKAANDVGRIQ